MRSLAVTLVSKCRIRFIDRKNRIIYTFSQVDSVLGDRFPTIEDMKKLKYTTRVINEV